MNIHSDSFQKFMTACDDLESEAGCTLQEATQRVLALCANKDQRFKDLVSALTCYDYHGMPSNYLPEYKHEETIIRWAEGVLENEDPDDIDDVIDSYKQGFISDCFNFMENYFC